MEKLYTLKEAKSCWESKAIQRWDREGKIRVVRTVGGRIPESEIKRILGLKEEMVVAGYAGVLYNQKR